MALTASSRGTYGDESPEALRRRADVLLDEMMLGGIDTGAAGPQTSGMVGGNGNGLTHWPSADEIALDYDGASYASTSNGPNGSYGEDVSGRLRRPRRTRRPRQRRCRAAARAAAG